MMTVQSVGRSKRTARLGARDCRLCQRIEMDSGAGSVFQKCSPLRDRPDP